MYFLLLVPVRAHIYRIDCGDFSDRKLDSGFWNIVLLNLVVGGCNVRLIEVVGGGGCKMDNFDGLIKFFKEFNGDFYTGRFNNPDSIF